MTVWSGEARAEWLPEKLLEASSGTPSDVLNALTTEPRGPLWDVLEDMVARLKEAADKNDVLSKFGRSHTNG
jgi:hypothetical protein